MAAAVLDMDNPRTRAAVINRVRELRGRWRFDVVRFRPRRSDRQNRYYHPCFVAPFGDLLREAGNDFTNEDAHELLKHKFLRAEWLNEKTGELETFTRSTAKLDTREFNEYLDRCAAWLTELGIEIPDPADYREPEPKPPAVPAVA